MYHKLVCFNLGSYRNYASALESGAVYETGSAMDAAYFGDGITSGLLDIKEVIETYTKCLGSDDIVFGIVNDHGCFMAIDAIVELADGDSFDVNSCHRELHSAECVTG
ncbi:hypothetical protein [Vibrio barjaei]|uniref:hypothetical protein n=1 Tax=Vibrio barjaei TaxID=1676683 RepID=UPI002284F608|nr:hypothetical protein [Vibrio barjaei]MCY9874008.1 hypothetical protein [Vibrio barjaei]